MSRKKTRSLPIEKSFVCGHNYPNDLQIGRETSIMFVRGKYANYVTGIEYGPCSTCNCQAEKRIKARVAELERMGPIQMKI